MAGNTVGLHEYTLVVLDKAGERVKGLNISIEPWMPDHGHGSDRPVEVNDKNSSFSVRSVSYTMPGLWELRTRMQSDSVEDSATIEVEVR